MQSILDLLLQVDGNRGINMLGKNFLISRLCGPFSYFKYTCTY